jgi:hypothetical protein
MSSGDPTRFPPWVVRTTTGKWCGFLSGVTGTIAGMRMNYGCVGGGTLIGTPKRSAAIWTIFYARSYTSSQYRPVQLTAAWW